MGDENLAITRDGLVELSFDQAKISTPEAGLPVDIVADLRYIERSDQEES